ncbi:hypothetical protein L3Y34_013434 [Caenorhabditis briggsae]|uniref:Calcineurin-like phosphoesterase domain-containing protein n=1 Tax=Caenorhabditis briggsae TaxID=6238 RepID=A0AAE9CWB8_CAEBR|nr:hypothetical protein L3Y34_013434 [Caenorhabditis briggsae]
MLNVNSSGIMESSVSSKQNVDFDSVRFSTMCNPPKDRDVGEINLENVPSYVVEESHLEIIRAADPQDIVEFDTKNDIQLVEYSAYDDRKDTVSTNQEDNNDSPNSSQGSVPALDFDTEHGYIPAAISSHGNDNVEITTSVTDHTFTENDSTAVSKAFVGLCDSTSEDGELADENGFPYPKEEPQPFSAPPTPIVSSDALHFFHLSPMEAFKQAVKELNDMKSEAVEKLLTRSCALHNKMENVIVVPDTVVAVGDLHEVLSTLDSIFNTQIEAFVFAGDYVDRGKNGTEIIVFFL